MTNEFQTKNSTIMDTIAYILGHDLANFVVYNNSCRLRNWNVPSCFSQAFDENGGYFNAWVKQDDCILEDILLLIEDKKKDLGVHYNALKSCDWSSKEELLSFIGK